MDKIVFISSTFEDLAEYRREVWSVLEGFHVTPKGMEQFGARSQAPLETCLAEVAQSDIYVGIIAFRIGSIDSNSDKSFTQLEYEHALRLGKEILIYLADENIARFRKKDFDFDQSQLGRLDAFKSVLKERHTVSKFSTPEDLAEKLKSDFLRHFLPAIETSESQVSEFESTLALVRRFRLLPKTVIGREIRLEIAPTTRIFPASRLLCKAFNLEYGRTIGAYFRIIKPNPKDMEGFREIYASGLRVDKFLSLMNSRSPVNIYAQLQFTPDDVPSVRAEFFGYEYLYSETDADDRDPEIGCVVPEGKVILLFSKTSS